MITGKFQLDRAGWRKVLISVFLFFVLYAGMVFATDWMEYHRVSLQLENLSDKPVAQVPQQDVVALEAILKVVQKHRREDMSIHATAVLFAVIGLVFVERKTRK